MSRDAQLPRTAVPQGGAAFFPDVAARKRQVEAQFLTTFFRWGYREVVPPLFEYLDVLSHGLVPEVLERGYKLENRQDGRLMVLRPDVTAQVARMAAARKDDPDIPHRYGYATNVYAQQEAHRGRPREVFQAGAELLGPSGVAADLEILSLLISALRDAGLSEFTVAVGQAAYFQAILDGVELPGPQADALTRAVARKDPASIATLMRSAGVDKARISAMEQVPFLLGGREVMATARKLTRCKEALTAIDHLEQVVDALDACGMGEHILIDLGEIRDLDYYTGLVFEVLVPELGFEIGGGGRYDGLVGRFGHPMPAIGFALDVERVMEAMARAGAKAVPPELDYQVEGKLADAHRAAARLREAGFAVTTALSAPPSEKSGVPRLLAEGDRLFRVSGDRRQPVDLDELVKG